MLSSGVERFDALWQSKADRLLAAYKNESIFIGYRSINGLA